MRTRYLQSLAATFNPHLNLKSHKIPRIMLSFIGSVARSATGGGMKVKTNVLPAASKEPSSLILTFKDGKELRWAERSQDEGTWDLAKVSVKDVVEEVERHSRILKRKEELGAS